ncbi:hypothetical protein N7516_010061 [Penicillium verrucosum]|uniref:uncharacterized protein n=1 Tax=Penicillium verrucosum TaxID=60171 RepID=UPI002544EA58|nr:uncharacterized protein N7516_010061 [Penicillium verrucosum]KAJ5922358.1 hypothetical protein N7516_010061 [Penicillium verrucosum]
MVDPISILSLVDLCLKYGKLLVHTCSAFAHASNELQERKVRVNHHWMRTEVQLEVLQQVEGTLNEVHRNIQQETLQILLSKLQIANESLEAVSKDTRPGKDEMRIRKWKYALLQQKIDKAIQELELWQQVFDPSWYLIVMSTSGIDTTLHSHPRGPIGAPHTPISSARLLRTALHSDESSRIPVFLPEEGLKSLQLCDIPLSTARIGQGRASTSSQFVLEQYELSPELNLRQFEKDSRDLAQKLAYSDALEFGLLNCKGVVRHQDKNGGELSSKALTFIFRVPSGFSQPRSLRKSLKDIARTESLSDRLRIARGLTKAVNYVHIFGFVHKNIRPETVILLNNGPTGIGSTFLIGFGNFRAAEGNTLRKGSSAWQKSLYQHPTRMGVTPTADYIMQHDIYSLGVCLLEVGLWESFVDYENAEALLPHASEKPVAIHGYSLDDSVQPSRFKDHLLSLAQGELRSRMGTIYSEVVVTCLTCLDPENVDFGDEREFQDEDGILVGARYIEKVIMRLNAISI